MTAPQAEPGYSLVVLDMGDDVRRIVRATIRTRQCSADEAIDVLRAPLPLRIARGLSDGAAREAQWEFVSCDCVAVFVRDDVVDGGGAPYLRSLFTTVSKSPEFAFVTLEVESVPDTEPGARYVDQFLGRAAPPVRVRIRAKKAHLMEEFGARMGVVVRRCEDGE